MTTGMVRATRPKQQSIENGRLFYYKKQSHSKGENPLEEGFSKLIMAFFGSAVDVLQKLVIGLGAGLGVWGGVNLMEGYGNDNPGAKSQGVKQLVAGGGVALIGITLVPLLANIFA